MENFFLFDPSRFTQVSVIIGLVIMAIAVVFAICAGAIANKIKFSSEVEEKDKVEKRNQIKLIIRMISLLIALIGALVAILFIK